MIKKKETALRRLRSKDCRWNDYKNYSPELQKDPEICLAAAENDGSVLMFIPEECRTREVCLAAVTGNGGATLYIPGEVKTDVAFWTEAVRREGHLISTVPADLLTEEICIDAVKQHADNLYWVPERLQTPKVCRIALENDYRVAVLNIRKSVLLEALNALEERYAKKQDFSRNEEHLNPRAVSCLDSNSAKETAGYFQSCLPAGESGPKTKKGT